MVSTAVAVGTGASPAGTKTYSFFVDGLDLVNYLSWPDISIDMQSAPTSNSGATFRLENYDGSLDFGDFWGFRAEDPTSFISWPLREVRLVDHARDEILFGGYVTSISYRIAYADKLSITLTCVGYSYLLDASIAPADFTVPLGVNSDAAILACVQACGLRGGGSARAEASASLWTDAPTSGGVDPQIGSTRWATTISRGTTLRSAIMQVVGTMSRGVALYIDNYKRLVAISPNAGVFASTAPINIVGPTEGAWDLEAVSDFSDYASHILITGSNLPAAGRWFEGRMYDNDSGTGGQQWSTYQPVAVDMTESSDVDDTYFEDIAGARLDQRQSGMYLSYRWRKGGSGAYGWRLMQNASVRYPQLKSSASNHLVNVTAFRLTFARPDYPQVDATLVDSGVWAIGSWQTAITPAATTAQYTKQRLTKRTS